eukprot:COSAG01_NODE_4000_length_5445_cov_14.573326_2_plen_51_part_00
MIPSVNRRRSTGKLGFGWLQNAWLLHARLKIHTHGARGSEPTQKTRGPVH